jgi:drug/metabolite transporter (DMT)-like permease
MAALVALLLWGGTAIANKVAVSYMDGLIAGVLRSMAAGIVALVACYSLRLPFPEETKDRATLTISGLTSFALWPILLSVGISRTTAGHAALIMAMIPIFTVLISSIDRKKIPTTGWWFGAGLAFTATVILLTNRGLSFEIVADGSSLGGDLIILAGSILCAVGYVAGGKLSPKIGTSATTFWGLSMALLVLIPVFLMNFSDTNWHSVPVTAWMAIAWMTFLSSLAGYALWFYALGQGGISRIGSLQLIMPVITLAAAVFILNESLTTLLVVTCAAIILGTYLAQRKAS